MPVRALGDSDSSPYGTPVSATSPIVLMPVRALGDSDGMILGKHGLMPARLNAREGFGGF